MSEASKGAKMENTNYINSVNIESFKQNIY
jgi:hypothetical protein